MIIGKPKIGNLYTWSPLPYDEDIEIEWNKMDGKTLPVPVNAFFTCIEKWHDYWIFLYNDHKLPIPDREVMFLFEVTDEIKSLYESVEKSKV